MSSTSGSPGTRYRSVLRNRQFLIFLASSNASTVGYAVYTISVVWLAYTISHNFLDVGAVLFLEYACYTATFLIGPIVDRARNQRTIFLLSYPVQAAAAAAIGLGVLDGFLSIGLLFALVVLISILWDATWAAINAAPGVLLTADEQFAASGVTGAVGGVLTIVGYALGGVLILVVGPEGGMFLYAALLGAGAVFALPLVITPPAGSEASFAESFREGWKLVVSGAGRPLLQLASVDSVQGFLAAASPILITLIAAETYHGSASSYGVLFTAFVIGGVAAGLGLGHWNPRGKVGLVMAGALAASGAAYLLAVALPSFLLLGAGAWFLVGFASAAYLDAKYVFFRGAAAPEKLGRLVSNMYLFPGITSTVGALVLSAVATGGAPVELGAIVGFGLVGAGILGLILPGVRRMRY
ncbi:MAG: hypothetical protein WA691_00590 [Thermoplasmata archaeon]